MLSELEQIEQEISQFSQELLVLLGQDPSGQKFRQVVELGCRKYPVLQAEHWVLAGPVQFEHAISHSIQVLVVVSPQYPTGQESRHVVESGTGCKKYPELHSEHWSLFASVQTEQAILQGEQTWFAVSFQYPVGGQE